MPWGIAVGAVVGAGASLYGARQQSQAAQRGADQATNETARQFNLIRQDTAPYRNIGNQALNALGSIYGYASSGSPGGLDERQVGSRTFKPSEVQALLQQGYGIDDILKLGVFEGGAKTSDISRMMQQFNLTPDDINRLQSGRFSTVKTPDPAGGAPGAPGAAGPAGPDYSAFFQSPDYQFRRGEGTRDIGNSFAARGSSRSGNALRALTEFNSNLAASEFGNYVNRQAALAGIGQTGVAQSAGAGMNTGNNMANIFQNSAIAQGNARASGIQGVNDAAQGGLQNYMLYRYLQPGGFGGGGGGGGGTLPGGLGRLFGN